MRKDLLMVGACIALVAAGCAKKPEPTAQPEANTTTMEPMHTNTTYTSPTYSSPPPSSTTPTYESEASLPPPEPITDSSTHSRSSGKHSSASSKEGGRTYTVQKGDTLSSIAKKEYGDASKWKKIADANKSRVPDANKLKVGTKLIIP